MKWERSTVTESRSISGGFVLALCGGLWLLAHGAPVAAAAATAVTVLTIAGAVILAAGTVALLTIAVVKVRQAELRSRPRVQLEEEVTYQGATWSRKVDYPAGFDPCLPASPVIRVDWLGRRRPDDIEVKELTQ